MQSRLIQFEIINTYPSYCNPEMSINSYEKSYTFDIFNYITIEIDMKNYIGHLNQEN
jgi:hypothetical protein